MAALATPAFAQTRVPADWNLKPTGLTGGDQFRLLFLSSTKRDGSVTDIATYNTFIQERAAAGHADIRSYSTGFRVVGCTADVDATANTSTTGTGVAIYWLDGTKVADDYTDFYDGSWDDEANDKNESGTNGPDTSVADNYPVTGCDAAGTEVIVSSVSRALGSILSVRVGRPNSSTTGDGPISGDNLHVTITSTRPMYGLSAVFQVNNPPTVANAIPDQSPTTGTAFNYAFLANTFSDGDSDTLTYMATKPDDTALPTWLSFDAGTRIFSGTPQNGDAGTVSVKVTANDGNGGSVSDEFDITVVDTTPPTLTRAIVNVAGFLIQLEFSENVQQANLPPVAAFEVTAGGSAVTVTDFVSGPNGRPEALWVLVSPVIRQGQAVVVAYEDPTAGNDTNAIQDTVGNDTPDFTTGRSGVPTVSNISTITTTVPGAPTGLTATASGNTRINLSWTAPGSTGGSAITGYKIEVSPDGINNWTTLEADTRSTATTYPHTGLAAGSIRYYRVSAINVVGAPAPPPTSTTRPRAPQARRR